MPFKKDIPFFNNRLYTQENRQPYFPWGLNRFGHGPCCLRERPFCVYLFYVDAETDSQKAGPQICNANDLMRTREKV